MSGHWPPEWDDPEEEFPEGADQADTFELALTGEAQLSKVTAYLASVPAPVLPDAVEARISAALAAEAAARARHAALADGTPADDAPVGGAPVDSAPADSARKLAPSGARARVRRRRDGGGQRRGFRVRPMMAAVSLGACLLLAGVGYAISRYSPESTFSSTPAAGSAAGASGATSSAAGSNALGIAPAASAASGAQHAGSSFVVTASGTKYQPATLAGQVRTRLRAGGTHATPGTMVPAAGASVTPAAVPGQALRGCVLRLTDGVPPRLVDRATYEGEPAYVIATASRIWVVGPGCTAAETEVVASVPLAG